MSGVPAATFSASRAVEPLGWSANKRPIPIPTAAKSQPRLDTSGAYLGSQASRQGNVGHGRMEAAMAFHACTRCVSDPQASTSICMYEYYEYLGCKYVTGYALLELRGKARKYSGRVVVVIH